MSEAEEVEVEDEHINKALMCYGYPSWTFKIVRDKMSTPKLKGKKECTLGPG